MGREDRVLRDQGRNHEKGGPEKWSDWCWVRHVYTTQHSKNTFIALSVCIAETPSFPCVAITLYPLYDRSSPPPSGAIGMWVVDQLVDCRTFDTHGEVMVDFGGWRE